LPYPCYEEAGPYADLIVVLVLYYPQLKLGRLRIRGWIVPSLLAVLDISPCLCPTYDVLNSFCFYMDSGVMADPQVVAHEGLEVAPNLDKPYDYVQPLPQHVHQQHIPQPDQTYRLGSQPNPPYYPAEAPQKREILGLRFTTFFLALALIVVVLAAAIGAGVGATSAVHNAK
jgi:hypothetical protein